MRLLVTLIPADSAGTLADDHEDSNLRQGALHGAVGEARGHAIHTALTDDSNVCQRLRCWVIMGRN